MRLNRPRKFWIITTLSIVTVFGLLWFASVYFLSTAEAIRHAEAFLFRRMSVAQLSQQGEYRFFFITNRKPQAVTGAISQLYSNERHSDLDFGRFDTEIMPSLGLGMLIDPTSWLQDEEIDLKRVETRSREDFVSELSEQASASKHGAVFILLHGYREAHESALRKTAFVGHVLDIDAPIVLFDWPGDQGGSLRALGLRLQAEGYRVLALRIPGHGTIPAGMLDLDWREMARVRTVDGSFDCSAIGMTHGQLLPFLSLVDCHSFFISRPNHEETLKLL